MDTRLTKERILDAAVELFSDNGYNVISVRDIANKVGIKPASLYNHFSSKHELLLSIYDYFLEQQKKFAPTPGELLSVVKIEHPHKVLMRLQYCFPSKMLYRMEQAIIIASREIPFDKDSEKFIRNFLIVPTKGILIPVLNEMIKLGKIEPLDVESFCSIVTNFAFSVAVLSSTSMRLKEKEWLNGLAAIITLVKPLEKRKATARLYRGSPVSA